MAQALSVLLLLLLSLWLYEIVYDALVSPLRKIPNAHFCAPFSRVWILWIKWSGQENARRLQAHNTFGTVVRVGPRELSINCIDNGVQTIYRDFEKPVWYAKAFSNYRYARTVSQPP